MDKYYIIVHYNKYVNVTQVPYHNLITVACYVIMLV